MSDLITRTARLVPYAKRPKQASSFVTAYSHEPLADQPGAELGGLYIALEVLISGRAGQEVADLIIETVGNQYYNNSPEISGSLDRFESAVKAVNHELSDYVNKGNAAWIGKLSAIIAIQAGSDLHITGTGSAEALLYRGKASTRIGNDTPNRPSTPSKTFGSIASGELEIGDHLLIATPALIHQVPLVRLQNTIINTTPNTAISEITHLLKNAPTERIAALVIEITTPEQAALQVRSEQPAEIQLGTPQNPLEAAKLAAAPLAHTTVVSSQKMATAAQSSWRHTKPLAQKAALNLVAGLRQLLLTKKRRLALLLAVLLLLCLISALGINHIIKSRHEAVFDQYQSIYRNVQTAQALLDTKQQPQARLQFVAAQKKLASLEPKRHIIDHQLASTSRVADEPRTFSELSSLINDRIDRIDGLIKLTPSTIASFDAKSATPNHLELAGDKIYVFSEGKHPSLSIINRPTGTVATSRIDAVKLGGITATTLSSNNDGIYLLTTKPSIWFYRFDTDTITEQTISFGQWPKAKAIASYATNLYLLTDDAIYKHTKNAAGFSPKTNYLTSTGAGLSRDSAMAVDGYVYTFGPAGLTQYLAGSVQQSAPGPSLIGGIINLRSVTNGTALVATSPTSKRIAIWSITKGKLNFDKQIALDQTSDLQDAVYDPKSANLYALADHRLVEVAARP